MLLMLLCTESLKSPKTSTHNRAQTAVVCVCRNVCVCVSEYVCVSLCLCVSAGEHTDNISEFNLIINALVVQPKTDIDNVRGQPVNYRVCSNCKPPAAAAAANGLQQVN